MFFNEVIFPILLTIVIILFLLYVPIFKPWFGFKKPKNHLPNHKWWT